MKALIAILLALASASTLAAELTPERQNGQLGARIQGSSLPDSFRRDLTSGLTNRLLIRLTLHHAARELHIRSVEVAVRYDLWDEKFIMTTRLDGATVDTIALLDVQQVMQRLQDIRLSGLFATSNVPANSDLVMRAVVLLNPIDRERMDAIRRWVEQNNSRSSLDPAGALGVGDISISNAIFNRIFEQYASGSDAASAWQQTLATRPFRVDRLSNELQ
jgi:hypothetical protein